MIQQTMRHGDQKKIAEWLGIKESFLSRILNGKKRPSPATAVKLEDVSRVDMRDWLLLPAGELRGKLFVAWENETKQKEAA